MPYFVGLDSSKRTTSICVIDREGAVVREGVVATEPKAIVAFLRGERRRYVRVGMEAWTLSPWLSEGLAAAGLPIVSIEVRHAHGVMKAQRHKTDRNDARGIAELMRLGAYRKVHVKSRPNREARALIRARSLMVEKARDVSNAIHGLLLEFGIKLGRLKRRTYEQRTRALVAGQGLVEDLAHALLAVRSTLLRHKEAFEARIIAAAREDPVCRRLMTAPGIGELTALLFRAAVDERNRFVRSRALGPHFGLTPKTYQSGDGAGWSGRITRWGDREVRRALFLASWGYFQPRRRESELRTWGFSIAERRGRGRAIVAVARKLAVILHRMWVSETDFQWERPA